ncbi:MAG: hypothetical protein HIU81_07020 [Acidobacteria bacterium]|nr:hypothetical protein [Acidobacteriota bacterium]
MPISPTMRPSNRGNTSRAPGRAGAAEQLATVTSLRSSRGQQGMAPAASQPLLRSAEADVVSLHRTTAAAEEATLVRVMAGRMCQATLEVLAGIRPVTQLSRWLDQRSFEALQMRVLLTRAAQQSAATGNVLTLHHRAVIQSIHCCPVAAGVYEVALIIKEQARHRAIAMRLEQTRGVWKVTALEIG